MPRLLNGRDLANRLRAEIAAEVRELVARGVQPHLVSVQVGDDQVSSIYVRNQQRACRAAGIRFTRLHLDAQTPQDDLVEHIDAFASQRNVTGVIMQMPLPDGIDARAVQLRLPPGKDVEGVAPRNLGEVVLGRAHLPPCTPAAVMRLLDETGVDLTGRNVVLVGHSEIVGKPLAMLLLDRFATLRVCHRETRDLGEATRDAEVLITATGVPHLITADMVRDGAIVIDVGFAQVPELTSDGQPVIDARGAPRSKTVGDVDFEAVKEKAEWITPVPGGVGPMTTTMLMRNTLTAAREPGIGD